MKAKLILSAALAAAVVAAPACAKKNAEKTDAAKPADGPAAAAAVVNPADLAADNIAKAQKFLAENAKKASIKTTPSGLQYTVLSEGPSDGFSPKAEDVVVVHYVGTHLDGMEFDSSIKRGAAAKFPLNGVIPGWTEGVQLMSEGDKYRFFIPSELAYGAGGSAGAIGPNEALIFDVARSAFQRRRETCRPPRNSSPRTPKRRASKRLKPVCSMKSWPRSGGRKLPTDANKVSVHYEGRLLDGSVFNSSYERGEPIEFPLARVIAGWTEGVQLMSEGDKFRFFIPPALAYGEGGTPGGPIGPNEALIFDVELLKVVD